MLGPFDSARRKVARADKHFDDLHREVKAFRADDPYRQVIEVDPSAPNHFLHKIKLVKLLDETSIAEIVGDVISNLRAALDHAIYATAIVSGCQKPRFDTACFPFARCADGFENTLKGRCKDVSTEMYPLLRSFQPYKGGNRFLYALNALRNADNHAVLTPFGTRVLRPITNVGGTGYFEMILPEYSRWDRTKDEIVFLRTRADTKVDYEVNFHFFIAFENIEVLEGYPMLEMLEAMGCEVNATLNAIEAETRRLGFIQ
jgi:hypothetical protein